MVKSMTGYGRAVETVNGREFTVEVRSVNNRYLDCTVKLPRGLSFGEDAVKQAVKATISRGKVDVFVSVRSEGAQDTAVSLNKPMVEGYLAALKQLQADYGVTGEITVSMLAGLPDVFLLDKPQVDETQLLADFLSVAEKALASFDAMRTTEGAALAEDLRSRGETILSLVSQVEAGSPQTVADYRARLEAKLQEVLANTSIDESRILTEAAIFADKVAVDEETVRLRSHLSQMNTMLASGGPIGRKLDFLLQEMNREANTIGSKCSDVRLARVVVEIKAELEKTSGLMAATVDYAKTRPVFDGYKAARYSKKYLSEHEAELAAYRAARATMNELLDGAKLPKMADMKKSRQELAGKKKALYAEYRKAQADMRQAVAVKANIDHLLGVTDGRENKAQER